MIVDPGEWKIGTDSKRDSEGCWGVSGEGASGRNSHGQQCHFLSESF